MKMTWWAWIILGVVLLSAELLAIDAQFYLVFLGISAILVGVAGSLGPDLPPWIEWLSFAALSVLTMFTVRRQLYEKVRGRPLGTVERDRKSTRLNSSHVKNSYAVFCLKKKNKGKAD